MRKLFTDVSISHCSLFPFRYNIRCNVILPGFVSTTMTDGIPEKVKTMFTSMIPMRRFGKPEGMFVISFSFISRSISNFI